MGEPEDFDRKEFISRVGTFFLLVGIILLVFFFLSDATGQATFSYFCWSTILLIVGFMFRSRLKKKVAPSGRFSIFNRFKKGK